MQNSQKIHEYYSQLYKRGEEYYHPIEGSASKKERELNMKLYDFGDDFFSDMMFEEDSIVGKYLLCGVDDSDLEGDHVEDYMPINDLADFSYNMVECKILDLQKGVAGSFNKEKMCILLDEKYIESDNVILHEMIHLHEHLLSFIDSAYRDILFFELYKKINNKIDGLDTLIEAWGNRVNQWEITRLGGIHSPLFLLKSLDIDIEKGYKLGTTLAYGQVDSISKLLKIRK